VVVGATPGGELGGTWSSPTVDATHSGSAHHAQAHNGAGADHTYSGLTTGHVLMATSATVAAFHAVWVQMTQAAYDGLGTKDPLVLYVIVG
jgi:hypothetical protein